MVSCKPRRWRALAGIDKSFWQSGFLRMPEKAERGGQPNKEEPPGAALVLTPKARL
jgi:hypothetical protein